MNQRGYAPERVYARREALSGDQVVTLVLAGLLALTVIFGLLALAGMMDARYRGDVGSSNDLTSVTWSSPAADHSGDTVSRGIYDDDVLELSGNKERDCVALARRYRIDPAKCNDWTPGYVPPGTRDRASDAAQSSSTR